MTFAQVKGVSVFANWFTESLCSAFSFLMLLMAIPAIGKMIGEYLEERAKANAAAEDAAFQREHPEAWRAKEMVKLEKERLAAEKELAERLAEQESKRRTAGLIAGIGRGLGWW